MSMVITIPKILQDKLGHDGANALAETLNKVEESHRDHVLEIAESKFERRLSQEIGGLRSEMTDLRSELKQEITNSRADMIKWMFIFWVGQITAFYTVLHK